MRMSDNCPICQTACDRMNTDRDSFAYECPRCGNFILSYHNRADLRRTFIDAKAHGEEDEKRAIVSHAIRKKQKEDAWPTLKGDLIEAIPKRSLPTPSEQKDIFIRWVGDNIKAGGDYIKVNSFSILAIIGAITLKEFYFILGHLKKKGLVESKTVVGGGDINIVKVTLSFDGHEYYEKLKRVDTDKRKSFMAIESAPKEQTHEVHDTNNDGNTSMEWDVFICHASEDKEGFVLALATSLISRGLKVWYDEFTLTLGDSLRRSIDKGLAYSRYGIVVISRNFLRKEWPQKELDGLTAREANGRKVILPVWHQIDVSSVREYSLTLADRVATSSEKGITQVVDDILEAMEWPEGTK